MAVRLAGIFLFACSFSYSQEILELNTKNIEKGRAYLINTVSGGTDTVYITKNTLHYSGKILQPTLFNLVIDGINNKSFPIRLILSPSTTSVTYDNLKPIVENTGMAKDAYPQRPTYQKDPNHNVLLDAFGEAFATFADSITALSKVTPDTFRGARQQLYDQYIRNTSSKIIENKDKDVSAVALYEFLIRNRLINIAKIEELYDRFTNEVKYGAMGSRIGEYINKEISLQIGAEAPYFEFSDLNEKKYTSTKLKGSIILLHFWSSYCGPCRTENADVAELSRKLKDKVLIINISLDDEKDRWINAMKKDGILDMVNTFDDKGTADKIGRDYFVYTYPSFFLIDENNIIVSRGGFATVLGKIADLKF